MKKSSILLVGAVLLATAPVSAQWQLSWGSASAPACYTSANSTMCLSAQLNYAADGNATLHFWNQSNSVGNDRAIVDNIAFSGLDAPTSSAFTLTRPDAVLDANWAYDTPPLGSLGNWGWGVAGGGICDETSLPAACGGNPAKKFNTDWNGGFNQGGAAVFAFFLGTGVELPTDPVYLWAHVRDAYQLADGSYTSDRFVCADSRSLDCGDTPGTPQETVPEPATMTLLATGLVGLAASRRRKKSA